jgi:hypothetical protein
VNAYAIINNVQLNSVTINWKLVRIFTVLSVSLLFVLYLYQVNNEISERYSVQESQKAISELVRENKTLEINTAKLGSLDSVTDSLEGLGFEKTDKIHYIKTSETHVVVK